MTEDELDQLYVLLAFRGDWSTALRQLLNIFQAESVLLVMQEHGELTLLRDIDRDNYHAPLSEEVLHQIKPIVRRLLNKEMAETVLACSPMKGAFCSNKCDDVLGIAVGNSCVLLHWEKQFTSPEIYHASIVQPHLSRAARLGAIRREQPGSLDRKADDFGLTNIERGIVSRLMQGANYDDVSLDLGITQNTVNSI